MRLTGAGRRPIGHLLTVAGAVFALGCGAQVAPDPTYETLDLSPAALGIPPASPSLRALGPRAPQPTPIDDPADARHYEVLLTLEGPRAFVVGAEAREGWQPAELSAEDGAAPGCPPGACGTASLPVGAPAEALWWLALADLHWQQAEAQGVNRSMHRRADETVDGRDARATRQILEFEPAPGVRCASQQKLFAARETSSPMPVERVIEREQQARAIEPARMPQARDIGGAGQLLFRQRTTPSGTFAVELHVAHDHAAVLEAEVYDVVVVCHSPAPVRPDNLGFGSRLARDDGGQLHAVVFPR